MNRHASQQTSSFVADQTQYEIPASAKLVSDANDRARTEKMDATFVQYESERAALVSLSAAASALPMSYLSRPSSSPLLTISRAIAEYRTERFPYSLRMYSA